MNWFFALFFKTRYNLYKFANKKRILAKLDKSKHLYLYFKDTDKIDNFNSSKVVYLGLYEYKNIIYKLNKVQKIYILNYYKNVTHIYRYLDDLKYKVYLVK